MKPLILLTGGTGAAANGTPTWALNQNYAENIRRAGGIPILAVNNDCAEEYADLADGLLLSGGKDVEPKLYGQEKMFDFVITDPQRDDLGSDGAVPSSFGHGSKKAGSGHLPRNPDLKRILRRYSHPGYPDTARR